MNEQTTKEYLEYLKEVDKPMKWISVEDELPELNEHGFCHCLGYSKLWGISPLNCERLLDTKFIHWKDWSGEISTPPTHWMPLPEPPKQ